MRDFMKILESFGRPKWQASYVGDDYIMFSIPSDVWSGGEYDEDTLKLYFYPDQEEWAGRTEYDQNIKRDLDPEQLDQIRMELDLDQSLEYYL